MKSNRFLLVFLLVAAFLLIVLNTAEASPNPGMRDPFFQGRLFQFLAEGGVQAQADLLPYLQADATADLSLALSVSNAAPTLGSTIAYTVTVTNSGPGTATGIVVRDALPAGYTYISSTASQGNYASGNGNWKVGTFNNGASARLRLNVTVNPTGSYSNYAQVYDSKETDPDSTPGNNSTTEDDDDTLATTPLTVADLSITKAGSPDPVPAGSTLQYTLVVSNAGPSPAASLIVSDTLPAALTSVTAASASMNCVVAGQRVSCTQAALASGGSAQVLITALVEAGTTGSLTNAATVASATGDPIPGNNRAAQTTTVTAAADVGVALLDGPDPVSPSASLNYTVTVTNAGPGAAAGLVFTNTFAAGLTYQSYLGAGWTCLLTGLQLRCVRAASLPAGATDQVRLFTQVDPATGAGILTDAVAVSSAQPDLNQGNNRATTTTTVFVPASSADLQISQTDSVDPVQPNTTMAYNLLLTNAGPADAVGVRITDTLPTAVTFITYVPETEWACTLIDAELRCGRVAPLPANSMAQLSLYVIVNASAPSGVISNLARVGSSLPDPADANNTDTETTTVVSISDLAIRQAASSNPVIAGTNLTYTLTVSNNGPSQAASLVVTDTLPAESTFQSFGGSSGWSCTLLAGNRLRCSGASLSAGFVASLVIKTRINSSAASPISNLAVVSSSSNDPNLDDNSTTLVSSIVAQADLSLEKTDTPDPVGEMQELVYRLVVRNLGPSDALNVSLSDVFPITWVTYQSYASTPTVACLWNSPNLGCSLGTLASGSGVTVTVTSRANRITDNQSKITTNSAAVSAAATDPSTANNSQTITTQVVPVANLQVNLLSSVSTIQTGNPLTYTLWITNTGPSVAAGVVVTDTLPAEFTYKSSTRAPSATSPQVVWRLGDLAAGQSVSYRLVVNVKSPTQILKNRVVARSAIFDSLPADSQDEVNVRAVDSLPPTVTWRLPVGNSGEFRVGRWLIRLEVRAVDNVGVSSVQFRRWDEPSLSWKEIGTATAPAPCQGNPSIACYYLEFDTSSLNPRWNQIKARAHDASGNYTPDGNNYIFLYYDPRQIYLPLIRR